MRFLPDVNDRDSSQEAAEHAIEQMPLSEIREGGMLQAPASGKWIKAGGTADGTMSVAHDCSDEDSYRVYYYGDYYGDGARRSIPGSLRASSIARSESNRSRMNYVVLQPNSGRPAFRTLSRCCGEPAN